MGSFGASSVAIQETLQDKIMRKKHPTNPNAVPIFRVREQVTVTMNGRKFTFRRTQFPLVLAYAITSHSAQGITKERVIIDFGPNHAKHALFSVPFSRAKTLDGSTQRCSHK